MSGGTFPNGTKHFQLAVVLPVFYTFTYSLVEETIVLESL